MDSTDPALFIMLGQPHLRERLLCPVHQSFNQRISLKFHFAFFTQEETGNYIKHQLRVAGVNEPIFNTNAVSAIYQNSSGNPREINSLAEKTMTIGALEKKDILSEEDVYRASKER